ncbi:E3 ubiquitin-protein ligase MIB2-like [Clytia hemisphaerica]|uniref:RING-type E3 ubiquitin transferase n=1 Tax=Clytia hemisphaerica TaxID=252671 RepID=A0A7M5UTY2_9CNID
MDIKGILVAKNYREDQWIAGTITDVDDDSLEVTWCHGKIEKFPKTTSQLYVYDIGPAGVQHVGIVCDGCRTEGLVDYRWKCTVCHDFDLCSFCYHGNTHNTEHVFQRIDIPGVKPVQVRKRGGEKQARLNGFFQGAKVKRGKDWEWGNQDGGIGTMGTVLGSYDWTGAFETSAVRSGVTISWEKSKLKANYRIGFNGKVDLICENPAFGGQFYSSHLANTKTLLEHKRSSSQGKQFNIGDAVVMCKKIETLVSAQEGSGGFIKEMTKCIGVVGRVVQTIDKGVFVQFGISERPDDVLALLLNVNVKKQKHWLLNRDILQKVAEFQPGDTAKVINDKDTFIVMQTNIGNYHPSQDVLVGEEVKIIRNDGEKLQIEYGNNKVFMSCGAVSKCEDQADRLLGLLLEGFLRSRLDEKEKEKEEEEKRKRVEEQNRSAAAAAAREEQKPVIRKPQAKKERSLRELVEKGDDSSVAKYLDERPYMINQFENGSTSLHVAVFNNDSEIVDIFLKKHADLSVADDNGDTVLHIAASKNLIGIGRKLVRSQCAVNKKNKSEMTALSVATHKGYVDFVRMLVFEKCDTDQPDYEGNIPLHVACKVGNTNLVRILLENKKDLLVPNRLGLFAIHIALDVENKEIIEMILDKSPEALNSTQPDGSTPLHFAVRRGKAPMVEYIVHLITKYRYNIDSRTKQGQTALHLACMEGFLAIVKLLLQHGADINAEMNDGNTSVLMCVLKHRMLFNLPPQLQGNELIRPDLRTVKSHFENTNANGIITACFLLENGANLNHFNHAGKSALDVCEDSELTKLLCEFGKKHRSLQEPSSPAKAPPIPARRSSEKKSTKPKIQKQESELDFDPCPLCQKRTPVEGRFQPCKHALFCYQHAETFQKCPQCFSEVTHLSRLSVERLPNCKFCAEKQINITFKPCGHQIACFECSKPFRVCITCEQRIEAKVPIVDGSPKPKPKPRPAPRKPRPNSNSGSTPSSTAQSSASAQGATAGGAAIPEEDENQLCIICFERPRNNVFQCGHTCCKVCSYAIDECHICRQTIKQRIFIYDN